MLYSKQLEIPSDISVEIIDNEHIYDEEYGNVNMAYDESGTRIWESTYTRGGYQGSNVTIPGIGIYRKETLAGDFKLTHLDLVGGGFRKGLAEEAIYPMVDAQGNVRAYASASGIKSAYDYRPFGRVEELEENAVTDERRWQGKEFDGEHGKYYFGARYFDPFFGMWMSPDPAGQFANPYTYGGDPINLNDPTGLWAVGLGLVVGWDNKSGWSFGVGAAADFGKIGSNFSYSFNQDGSKSLNLGVKADIPIPTPWVYLEINMGLGFSMNSYSGATLSTHGGLCVGEVGLCGGVETGGSLYWDRGGSFMGATVYAEAYASLGYGMARVSTGYEAGLFGMEGRGLYAGGNLTVGPGLSLYASWAENGGTNYGFEGKFNYRLVNNGPKEKFVGFQLGPFDLMNDHDARNKNQPDLKTDEEFKEYAKANGMVVGYYPESQSAEHKPGINNKMWMAKSKPFSLFGFLLTIPSIEGVFNKNTGKSDPGSASYNYGNNWASHFLLDYFSWKMLDVWFPNP